MCATRPIFDELCRGSAKIINVCLSSDWSLIRSAAVRGVILS